MRKTLFALAVAAAFMATPALAGSTWEGEFFGAGPGNGYSGSFDATLSHGTISGDVTSIFMGSTFEPANLRFSGTYKVNGNGRMTGSIPLAGGKFTGWRGQGKVNATFKSGGGFNATKTGKDSGGGKRGK